MKIAVAGLWHLGSVTAACLAHLGFDVIAYDAHEKVIDDFKKGQAPIYEPGLNELLSAPNLRFTTKSSDLADADIIWVTYDTPVDDEDKADVNFVLAEIKKLLIHLKPEALVLISSQIPVGSTRELYELSQKEFAHKKLSFAYSPENLRLGNALKIFLEPERIVLGIMQEQDKTRLLPIIEKLTHTILWMSLESAEMTKHALNAFLATSIVFINELAGICEQSGADVRDVERGLKSEMRIGPRAYLRAGSAFAGGTLARDVTFLKEVGAQKELSTPLLHSVIESNQLHKQWAIRRLTEVLGHLDNKTIAILGLTYKPGTDTLRRSSSVEICHWLKKQGARIHAYDPALSSLPKNLDFIDLKKSIEEALDNAEAVVIGTECPEFQALKSIDFASLLAQPIILDANGFLAKTIPLEKIKYFSVGRNA